MSTLDKVRAVIAEELGLPAPPADDATLEALGADSLDRVQIAIAIERAFGLGETNLVDAADLDTARKIAEWIDARPKTYGDVLTKMIEKSPQLVANALVSLMGHDERKPMTIELGDYVLVDYGWLEVTNLGAPFYEGALHSHPVPAGLSLHSHPVPAGLSRGETIRFTSDDVRDHVKAADVPQKIVEDFFRIQPEQDPAFDRAWWDMAAQDQQKQTMQTYITTKIIQATPSEKEIDGVLTPGYAVFYPDGYASWCPKAEFERTARPISASESGFVAGDHQDA